MKRNGTENSTQAVLNLKNKHKKTYNHHHSVVVFREDARYFGALHAHKQTKDSTT
jgi:hypothetical protein